MRALYDKQGDALQVYVLDGLDAAGRAYGIDRELLAAAARAAIAAPDREVTVEVAAAESAA